jgi:hypothetical protein
MDERVKFLVYAMQLPGIHTYTSCGGHRKITHPSQSGPGEFNVGFVVEPTEKGFRSLKIITLAAQRLDEDNITVRTHVIEESHDALVFSVEGKNKTSPDVLAGRILSISDPLEE